MNTTGHAFVEARKRKALKEYKKLLRETREKRSTEPTTSESEQNLHPSQLDAKRRETLVRVISFSIYIHLMESPWQYVQYMYDSCTINSVNPLAQRS